jgi:pimeloyl-ACP methyl ester carboxylesterase
MSRHFLSTPLGQVHFVEEGNNEGTPVLLFHQTPRSIDEYADVIPILAEEFRVIAMDTPGYGDSDKPEKQPTIEKYATVIPLLMDHLNIPKAHLVAHHMGTFLTIEIAASHPERVDKMVISGPHYMDEEERQTVTQYFKQWRVQPDGSHLGKKWRRFCEWVEDPMLIQRILLDLLKAGESSEFGHYAAALYKMEERLPLLKGPALVIIGKKDPFANREKSHTFANTIPNCQEVYIEDGGIFLPSEKPLEWAHLIMKFIKSS